MHIPDHDLGHCACNVTIRGQPKEVDETKDSRFIGKYNDRDGTEDASKNHRTKIWDAR